MKKAIKGILISVIVLIIVYIILVLTKVLPNPFLDTKDLVCKKTTYEVDYESNKIITTKFDKWAIVNNIIHNDEVKFKTKEEAQQFYEGMKESIGKNYDKYLSIEDEKVIINKDDYKLTEEDLITKEQTKTLYENGGYECE